MAAFDLSDGPGLYFDAAGSLVSRTDLKPAPLFSDPLTSLEAQNIADPIVDGDVSVDSAAVGSGCSVKGALFVDLLGPSYVNRITALAFCTSHFSFIFDSKPNPSSPSTSAVQWDVSSAVALLAILFRLAHLRDNVMRLNRPVSRQRPVLPFLSASSPLSPAGRASTPTSAARSVRAAAAGSDEPSHESILVTAGATVSRSFTLLVRLLSTPHAHRSVFMAAVDTLFSTAIAAGVESVVQRHFTAVAAAGDEVAVAAVEELKQAVISAENANASRGRHAVDPEGRQDSEEGVEERAAARARELRAKLQAAARRGSAPPAIGRVTKTDVAPGPTAVGGTKPTAPPAAAPQVVMKEPQYMDALPPSDPPTPAALQLSPAAGGPPTHGTADQGGSGEMSLVEKLMRKTAAPAVSSGIAALSDAEAIPPRLKGRGVSEYWALSGPWGGEERVPPRRGRRAYSLGAQADAVDAAAFSASLKRGGGREGLGATAVGAAGAVSAQVAAGASRAAFEGGAVGSVDVVSPMVVVAASRRGGGPDGGGCSPLTPTAPLSPLKTPEEPLVQRGSSLLGDGLDGPSERFSPLQLARSAGLPSSTSFVSNTTASFRRPLRNPSLRDGELDRVFVPAPRLPPFPPLPSACCVNVPIPGVVVRRQPAQGGVADAVLSTPLRTPHREPLPLEGRRSQASRPTTSSPSPSRPRSGGRRRSSAGLGTQSLDHTAAPEPASLAVSLSDFSLDLFAASPAHRMHVTAMLRSLPPVSAAWPGLVVSDALREALLPPSQRFHPSESRLSPLAVSESVECAVARAAYVAALEREVAGCNVGLPHAAVEEMRLALGKPIVAADESVRETAAVAVSVALGALSGPLRQAGHAPTGTLGKVTRRGEAPTAEELVRMTPTQLSEMIASTTMKVSCGQVGGALGNRRGNGSGWDFGGTIPYALTHLSSNLLSNVAFSAVVPSSGTVEGADNGVAAARAMMGLRPARRVRVLTNVAERSGRVISLELRGVAVGVCVPICCSTTVVVDRRPDVAFRGVAHPLCIQSGPTAVGPLESVVTPATYTASAPMQPFIEPCVDDGFIAFESVFFYGVLLWSIYICLFTTAFIYTPYMDWCSWMGWSLYDLHVRSR